MVKDFLTEDSMRADNTRFYCANARPARADFGEYLGVNADPVNRTNANLHNFIR